VRGGLVDVVGQKRSDFPGLTQGHGPVAPGLPGLGGTRGREQGRVVGPGGKKRQPVLLLDQLQHFVPGKLVEGTLVIAGYVRGDGVHRPALNSMLVHSAEVRRVVAFSTGPKGEQGEKAEVKRGKLNIFFGS